MPKFSGRSYKASMLACLIKGFVNKKHSKYGEIVARTSYAVSPKVPLSLPPHTFSTVLEYGLKKFLIVYLSLLHSSRYEWGDNGHLDLVDVSVFES